MYLYHILIIWYFRESPNKGSSLSIHDLKVLHFLFIFWGKWLCVCVFIYRGITSKAAILGSTYLSEFYLPGRDWLTKAAPHIMWLLGDSVKLCSMLKCIVQLYPHEISTEKALCTLTSYGARPNLYADDGRR